MKTKEGLRLANQLWRVQFIFWAIVGNARHDHSRQNPLCQPFSMNEFGPFCCAEGRETSIRCEDWVSRPGFRYSINKHTHAPTPKMNLIPALVWTFSDHVSLAPCATTKCRQFWRLGIEDEIATRRWTYRYFRFPQNISEGRVTDWDKVQMLKRKPWTNGRKR